MPAPRHPSPFLALLAFTAAAVAGWFSVREPGPQSHVAAAIAARAPRTSASTKPTAAEPPAALLARLEHSLVLTLDPSAEGPCHGERLRELLRSLVIGPGPQPVWAYARRWAETDPQGMFDWLQSHGGFVQPMGLGSGNTTFLDTLFIAWAKRDPEKALTAALQLEGKFDRPTALGAVIGTLCKTDPARARVMATENLATLVGSGAGHFSAHGPEYRKTWDFLRSLPPGKARGTLLGNFFDEVCQYHHKESVPLWQDLPADVRREMTTSPFNRMYTPASLEGQADLQRAHVEQTGDWKTAAYYLQSGAREWAQRDPAAAIGWAQQHLRGRQRVEGTAALFREGAARNFDATLQVWHSLPDGILRARAAGHLAGAAPVERKAEMDALMESLTPADRGLALPIRRTAEEIRSEQEANEQRRRAPQ